MQSWIACQNSDKSTNDHVSTIIGMYRAFGLSGGEGKFDLGAELTGQVQRGGAGWRDEFRPKVRPEVMSTDLRKGTERNGYQVDAIVYGGGIIFRN
jgi:hypothetical protein